MRALALLLLPLLASSCALLYEFGGGDGGGAGTSSTSDTGVVASVGSGQGSPCERDAACVTGHCVDGVCCDTTCDGACQRCSEAGTCEPLQQGTECGPGSCNGGVFQLPSECSPGGACITGEAVTCLLGCAGEVCAGCTPGDCDADQYCPPRGGACVDRLPLGASCAIGEACMSGHCTDGVCCVESCLDPCESCNAAGACMPSMVGFDPNDECPQDPGCGRTGLCSGLGSCALQEASTICTSQTCSSDTLSPNRYCDGNGSCAPGTSMPCPGGFVCNAMGTACLDVCNSAADCVMGRNCFNGACTSLAPNGTGCATGNECASGQCVDQVCCDSVCFGQCIACAGALTGQANGKCAPVVDGTMDSLCAALPNDPCGNTGRCASAQCEVAGAGVDCPDTCSANAFELRTCNGAGQCEIAGGGQCQAGEETCCASMSGIASCLPNGSTCF